MKHIPFCIFIILFALFGNMLSAQERQPGPLMEDYDNLTDAKIDAVIFRGPTYIKYPYRFDGTFYAYSDEFLESRINYNGKEYLVLLPAEEAATEIVILEVEPVDEENENYLSVSDESILDAVYGIFKDRYKDILTFED